MGTFCSEADGHDHFPQTPQSPTSPVDIRAFLDLPETRTRDLEEHSEMLGGIECRRSRVESQVFLLDYLILSELKSPDLDFGTHISVPGELLEDSADDEGLENQIVLA